MEIKKHTLTMRLELQRESLQQDSSLCLSRMSLEALLDVERDTPFLHPQEREHADSLRFDRRKASYLLGRYCAKSALKNQFPELDPRKIHITSGVFGQPVIRSPEINGVQLSIAHCEDFGAALVFDESHPMAIDLERLTLAHQKSLAPELTVQEIQLLQDQRLGEESQAYTWIWTVKEALAKVLKTGLTAPLAIYEVSDFSCHPENVITAQYKNFTQYKGISFPWRGTIVSIALPRKTEIRICRSEELWAEIQKLELL